MFLPIEHARQQITAYDRTSIKSQAHLARVQSGSIDKLHKSNRDTLIFPFPAQRDSPDRITAEAATSEP